MREVGAGIMEFDLKAKVSILGDYSVGKTSLILRYVRNLFEREYKPTLGADFVVKKVQIKGDANKTVTLALWDLAGQDDFRDLRNLYLAGSVATLICFDLTSKSSFANLPSWIGQLKQVCGEIPFLVVGTKSDLEAERAVSKQEAERHAEELTGSAGRYFEISSLLGQNVNRVFSHLIEHVILKQQLDLRL